MGLMGFVEVPEIGKGEPPCSLTDEDGSMPELQAPKETVASA